MNVIQASVMGVVQGLSEFLPISSSAHLVFAGNFFKIPETQEVVFFDIMLHLGTLIAVFAFFFQDILKIIKALFSVTLKRFQSLFGIGMLKQVQHDEITDAKTGLYIMLGTVITVVLAFPMEKIAEKLVFAPEIVGALLAITGVLLLVSEKKSRGDKQIGLKSSVVIALAQGLAILPGFSRSGWTIAAGLFSGVSRVEAARYSFLLSIPIILGASMLYPFIKIDLHEAAGYNWHAIIAGTVVSGLTGYLCVKYFIKFLSRFSLAVFGYYCIAAGIIACVVFGIF